VTISGRGSTESAPEFHQNFTDWAGPMTPQRLIMLVFFLQPIAFGSWLPRIPDIQQHLGVGPAGLALALLGMPVGTLLTLPFAGRLVARIGARATIIYGFIVYSLVMALPALAWNSESLFVALMLAGAAVSTLELGLNVKADEVEKHGGRAIMSTCHGFWSLGIMAGSVVGSTFAALSVPAAIAIPLAGLIVLPVALYVGARLPDHGKDERAAAAAAPRGRWQPPGPILLGICMFVFGIGMTEGAVADWSAVFLRDVFAAPTAQAGLAYSVFAALVATGRFSGDWLRMRYGAVALARFCGTCALIGLVIVYFATSPQMAVIGFAVTGFGVSVGFPLAVTAAASQPDRPASASVAVLSFIALTGFLIGPPMIGFVAEHTSMRGGLAMLLPFLAISLLLTGMLRSGARKGVVAEPV